MNTPGQNGLVLFGKFPEVRQLEMNGHWEGYSQTWSARVESVQQIEKGGRWRDFKDGIRGRCCFSVWGWKDSIICKCFQLLCTSSPIMTA